MFAPLNIVYGLRDRRESCAVFDDGSTGSDSAPGRPGCGPAIASRCGGEPAHRVDHREGRDGGLPVNRRPHAPRSRRSLSAVDRCADLGQGAVDGNAVGAADLPLMVRCASATRQAAIRGRGHQAAKSHVLSRTIKLGFLPRASSSCVVRCIKSPGSPLPARRSSRAGPSRCTFWRSAEHERRAACSHVRAGRSARALRTPQSRRGT
jgi:hypothetical protein